MNDAITKLRGSYWILTVLTALLFAVPGVALLLRVPHFVQDMAHLGYPSYFLTILGIWKALGAWVILAPGMTSPPVVTPNNFALAQRQATLHPQWKAQRLADTFSTGATWLCVQPVARQRLGRRANHRSAATLRHGSLAMQARVDRNQREAVGRTPSRVGLLWQTPPRQSPP